MGSVWGADYFLKERKDEVRVKSYENKSRTRDSKKKQENKIHTKKELNQSTIDNSV